jgi:hypothetical protein
MIERWRLWRAERRLARLNRHLKSDLARVRQMNAGLRQLLKDREGPL